MKKVKYLWRIILQHKDPFIAASYKREGLQNEIYRYAYTESQAKWLAEQAFPELEAVNAFRENEEGGKMESNIEAEPKLFVDPDINMEFLTEQRGREEDDINQKLADQWEKELAGLDKDEKCAALSNRLNGVLSLKDIMPDKYQELVDAGLDEEKLLNCTTDKCAFGGAPEED